MHHIALDLFFSVWYIRSAHAVFTETTFVTYVLSKAPFLLRNTSNPFSKCNSPKTAKSGFIKTDPFL